MKTYTTLVLMLLSTQLFSQDQAKLLAWQQSNPTALVMTYERFAELDADVQEKIAATVVFVEDMWIEQSKEFTSSASALHTTAYTEEQVGDAQFIKEWLATHPEVKIVKRSEYEAEETSIREIYDAPHILVLIGEEITKEDILNF